MASDRMIHQNLQSRGISVSDFDAISGAAGLEKAFSSASESGGVVFADVSAMGVKMKGGELLLPFAIHIHRVYFRTNQCGSTAHTTDEPGRPDKRHEIDEVVMMFARDRQFADLTLKVLDKGTLV